MTFAPGYSGNPGGRPKGLSEVRDLARKHTAKAIRRLITECEKGDTSAARTAAANALLDRGWGKPTQPLAGDENMPGLNVGPQVVLYLPDNGRNPHLVKPVPDPRVKANGHIVGAKADIPADDC